MLHRHLNDGVGYVLPAIDDVIDRGKREDWAKLRFAALQDRAIMEDILYVALARAQDPYAQRYHFWRQHAEQHLRLT